MKTKLLITLILIPFYIFSQKDDSSILKTTTDDTLSQNNIKKEYYESGKLKTETPFINGVENGIEKWYNENGNLSYETPYINGKINGVEKAYYTSGKLEYENIYIDNQKNGIQKGYYEDGQLKSETNYVNNNMVGKPKLYNLVIIKVKAEGEYVVTLKNDTIPITLINWTNTKIVCMAKGVETQFKAKNILAYNIDSTIGKTGRICPTLIGFKKWMFLDKIIPGKVSLFQISANERNINTAGSPPTYSSATIWYVRKYNEPKRQYHKLMSYSLLKRLMRDCPQFLDRVNSKSHKITDFIEDVEFYNSNCK